MFGLFVDLFFVFGSICIFAICIFVLICWCLLRFAYGLVLG